MPTVGQSMFYRQFHHGATLEDFADRLNHFWTFGLLLVLACIISWIQNYGYPIQCWTPAEFTDAMVDYANSKCWNSYLIYLTPTDERSFYYTNIKVTLYQMIPLMLCFQALLFKLPNIIMYIGHSFSGTDFHKLMCLTAGHESKSHDEHNIMSHQAGRYFYNWCNAFNGCLPWRLLTLLWFSVKILYCVNIFIQIWLVNRFLLPHSTYENVTSYGEVISGNIFKNNATIWKYSSTLPRNILCDFKIFSFRNIHYYTVQCSLPFNQLTEFVYMFIWVWFLFVAIVTHLSAIVWFVRTLVPLFRKRYINKALALSEDSELHNLSTYEVNRFCDFIGEDGVTALKLVAANSSELFVSQTVCAMWKLKTRGTAYIQPEQRVHTAPGPCYQTGPFSPESSAHDQGAHTGVPDHRYQTGLISLQPSSPTPHEET